MSKHLPCLLLHPHLSYVASDTPLIMDALLALVPKWNFFQLSESKHKELSLIAHPHEYSQRHFHAHVLSEKIDFTRGQIVDMHFLAGGWAQNPSNANSALSEDEKVRLRVHHTDRLIASVYWFGLQTTAYGNYMYNFFKHLPVRSVATGLARIFREWKVHQHWPTAHSFLGRGKSHYSMLNVFR